MKMHKIGGHVLSEHRNKWGEVAPKMVCCVSLQTGAFEELPPEAIKIFRTQALSNHVDIAGDFDKHPYEKQYEIGAWWWTQLKPLYEPVQSKYKNIYFQPINEINNHKAAPYMEGMMDAAHKDGYKLALFGDAGDSPTWENFEKYWVPVLKKGEEQGHIYCRHAYSGVGSKADYLTNEDGTPTDDNTGRPFKEAQYLIDLGISIPIVIGELGWNGGYKRPGYHFLADLTRYNELLMKYDNIVGGALWTWGNWPTKEASNLGGEKTADLAGWMSSYEPKFYDFSFKAKGKTKVKEKEKELEGVGAAQKVKVGPDGSEIAAVQKETNGASGADRSKLVDTPHDSAGEQTITPTVHVTPVLAAKTASGGLADHMRALIYQMAALGLHNPNVLQLAMAGTMQPLTHELRLNYGGQEYLVQLAQGGQEWRAYFSPLNNPTNISYVSTAAVGFAKETPKSLEARVLPAVTLAKKSAEPVEEQTQPQADIVKEQNFDQETDEQPVEIKEINLIDTKSDEGVMLRMSFRSQNGPGAQKFGGDCGPTCTTMIIEEVIGARVDPDEMMVKLGKTSSDPYKNWTDFTHLERALNWYGVQGNHHEGVKIDDIEAALLKGHPVIALVHYGSLNKSARNSRIGFGSWHFVVVIGFDADNIYFYDPLQDKETASKTSKTNFYKAMEAQAGVNNSHQIMDVHSTGSQAKPAWADKVPAGYTFIPAVGDRATRMTEPSGNLTEAWVYTGENNPSMIRKGKLVEVKTGHLNARLGPGMSNTLLQEIYPGHTMILTGEYSNGYAQVKINLREDLAGQVNGQQKMGTVAPGVGTRIDLKDYFFAEPGKQIMVKHPSGNSEKFLTIDLKDGWYLMQKNHKWELWKVDDEYIYLVDDVSPADAGDVKRFYRVRKSQDTSKLTPYCKRYMRVGEEFRDGGHFVQFYRISNGHKHESNSGSASNYFKFIGKLKSMKALNDQDVVEDLIHVKGGTEEHWFARGLGRVAWTSKWGESKIEEIIKNYQEPPKIHIPNGYSPPEGVKIEGERLGNEGF